MAKKIAMLTVGSVLVACLNGLWIGSSHAQADEATDVSIVALIVAPAAHDGQWIRVDGVLNIESEDNALYLHEEDRLYLTGRNALWLTLTKQQMATWDALSGKHVLVEGRLDASERGHWRGFAAAIRDVRRIEALRRR